MDSREFALWKRRHRLTNESAALVFGVSRRYINSFSSGQREVPILVEAACHAYDHGWRPAHVAGALALHGAPEDAEAA